MFIWQGTAQTAAEPLFINIISSQVLVRDLRWGVCVVLRQLHHITAAPKVLWQNCVSISAVCKYFKMKNDSSPTATWLVYMSAVGTCCCSGILITCTLNRHLKSHISFLCTILQCNILFLVAKQDFITSRILPVDIKVGFGKLQADIFFEHRSNQ